METHRFDKPPVVDQGGLVLDVITGHPGLDLVAQTL